MLLLRAVEEGRQDKRGLLRNASKSPHEHTSNAVLIGKGENRIEKIHQCCHPCTGGLLISLRMPALASLHLTSMLPWEVPLPFAFQVGMLKGKKGSIVDAASLHMYTVNNPPNYSW